MVVFKARFDNMALTEHNHDCSELHIKHIFTLCSTTQPVFNYQHDFNYFLFYFGGKNKVCIKFQPFLEKVEQLNCHEIMNM